MKDLMKESRAARMVTAGGIASMRLADGIVVSVSAEQIATMTIEPHGNAGRSRVVVSCAIELEVCGEPDHLRQEFAKKFAAALNDAHKRRRSAEERIRELETQLADAQRPATKAGE